MVRAGMYAECRITSLSRRCELTVAMHGYAR